MLSRLLWACSLLPVAAQAFIGSFEVCDKRPQYVRVEVQAGFAPADCVAAAARVGDYIPLLLLPLGFVMPVCAAVGGERATLYLDPKVTDDSVMGHELRHAFPPAENHPYFLPMVSLPCDMQ